MLQFLTKAPKIQAGKVEKVVDEVLVDPDEISGGHNSKWGNPENYGHTEESIESKVKSFKEHGQLQNVIARRLGDGKLELVAGFGRWVAAGRFNGRYPDEPMKLRVTVVEADELEAFKASIIENEERQEASPVDQAFAQQRLREKFEMTNADIAKLYGQDPAHVTRLSRFLPLRNKVLELIHSRVLPVQVAYKLASLPPATQDEVIKQVKEQAREFEKDWKKTDKLFKDEPPAKPASGAGATNGEAGEAPLPQEDKPAKGGKKAKPTKGGKAAKPSAGRVATKAIREAQEKAPPAPAPANGEKPTKKKPMGKPARDLKEMREFWEGFGGPGDDANLTAFAAHMLDFMSGELTEADFIKVLDEMIAPFKVPA